MALKFLNKKGWHTGSLRNIENVWKAEQKHNAEEKKLDELRKQIQEERERSEFRLLQEQAGLVPRQERLDFLYESGLAVGKSSEGFKELAVTPAAVPAEASSSKAAAPGALFEDKPQSANDTWRKLHTDPLLLIRQREKEALDRIKNNPMKMAMIKKSVEADMKGKNNKKDKLEKKDRKRKHKSKHSSKVTSDSEETSEYEKKSRKSRKKEHPTSERHRYKSNRERHSYEDLSGGEGRKRDPRKHSNKTEENRRVDYETRLDSNHTDGGEEHRREGKQRNSELDSEERRNRQQPTSEIFSEKQRGRQTQDRGYHRRQNAPKLSEEERAARLREMQIDAELHEEQRWKRLKKAADADAREVISSNASSGKNFLDAAQRSIYGAEKGGSSTIEESVRRRAYYSQGGSAANESNAFRR